MKTPETEATKDEAATGLALGSLLGGFGKTHEVWKYGGGTQSVAIAALILQGKLPRPEIAIIADTGKERSSTWQYMDEIVAPKLATIPEGELSRGVRACGANRARDAGA